MSALLAPDVLEAIGRVQEQLGEQLELLDREGGTYARSYAWASMTRPKVVGPVAPRGMHPKISSLIRELVIDELMVRRYSGASRAER